VALRAKAATTIVPIVFVAAEDPVRLGLVKSLARPDGNLTGINFFSGELVAKRLELLKVLAPATARVATRKSPQHCNHKSYLAGRGARCPCYGSANPGSASWVANSTACPAT
jgi:putative tryptophan/tyrosine transport system substrate-binding protein